MHPQLVAQLLGCPLPPQPGESGAPLVAVEAPLVQPGDGHQSAQAVCVHGWVLVTDFGGYQVERCVGCEAVRHV